MTVLILMSSVLEITTSLSFKTLNEEFLDCWLEKWRDLKTSLVCDEHFFAIFVLLLCPPSIKIIICNSSLHAPLYIFAILLSELTVT